MKGWEGRGEGWGGNERGGKRRGLARVNSYPHVQNLEKYPDCRTDLIGGGGNTDVCCGRQIPSRRHCKKHVVNV